MDVQFDEKDFSKFTEQARGAFQRCVGKFGANLVEEANRVEAGRHRSTTSKEVTASVVEDADLILRRGLRPQRRSKRIVALRISAGALPLLLGITYDTERLQDPIYMAFFVGLVVVSILALTLSVMLE